MKEEEEEEDKIKKKNVLRLPMCALSEAVRDACLFYKKAFRRTLRGAGKIL